MSESQDNIEAQGRFSPVQRSVHTRNLYNDDFLVREPKSRSHEQTVEGKNCSEMGYELSVKSVTVSAPSQQMPCSASEQVSRILSSVPAPDVDSQRASGAQKGHSDVQRSQGQHKGARDGGGPVFSLARMAAEEKDKPLDSSVNSQASILDEVYRMSLHEENMRSQISTVDLKISKLRSLIEEASQQLDIFSDEKRQLEKQEKSCRTKRIKLLEESRSSSACSQTGAGGLPSYLASQYSDNPVFMKFLMSRQSDVSSIGGFSNVESGSQPDSDVQAQRRGSFTSNVSEPNSAGDLDARITTENPASPLFSKSLDVLTGSTETITSSKSKGFEFSSSETSTPRASNEQKPKEDPHNDEVWTNDALNSNNTVSFINTPLEKVGFVTLEALMKGSEGSDSEKRKVSMKYMGTLPGGMNYEAFVKQMSEENKNKNIMFTVFNSPDAVSQQLLKKTPDAEIKTPGHSKPSLLSSTPGETGYKSDTNTSTRTLTDCGEEHSVISLGEQIMRLCDGQRGEESSNLEMITPRSGTDTFDDITPRVLSKERQGTPERNLKLNGTLLQEMRDSPVKDCSIALERIDVADSSAELLKLLEGSGPYTKPASGARSQSPIIIGEAPSPVRKRLKSKKERDQQSRRKQKESFILQSDTNSENETEGITQRTKLLAKWTQSEEDLCQSGSEERTPRILPGQSEILPSIAEMSVVKKSLLDEVQLETETPSDSCEDRSQQLLAQHETIPSIHYKGASLSVACMQVFNDDLYVCYNGSEIRRFDLKTGQVLKELDCSPYLVNCMHIVNVEDRGGVLYTGGACRKLMLFTPEKFNLISTYDYGSRLTCLHSNWGRLFIAFTDGNVSCRSLKTDKELNCFTCTTSPVHAMVSTSAGMTKMLCLATGDKAIYVNGEFVISGGTDKAIAVHSVTSGELLQLALIQIPVTNLYCHDNRIYSLCGDSTLRTFGMNLRAEGRHEMDRVLTSVLVANGYLLVGNREGLVTGQCMDRLLPYVCKFGSCRQQFRTTEDIKLHVISEHTMIANLSHCDYLGCDHKAENDDDDDDDDNDDDFEKKNDILKTQQTHIPCPHSPQGLH
ncbi:ZN106-like protein [Mya arenaria]|uniref:ZN106-like protein n=1 Tax=Mya arenaria TaxID=6604 RepID=A0ABY7FE57_MYAAR|nr:ZN106-like protein [Mya arenaria]